MTKEDWARVEVALAHLYRVVKLRVDEYDVALMLGQVSAYKNLIIIEVNGCFKGEWLSKDCEERRRFCHRREQALFSAKQKATWNKMSKRAQKQLSREYRLDIEAKYEFYDPYWTSFRALKTHLINHNTSIELISIT